MAILTSKTFKSVDGILDWIEIFKEVTSSITITLETSEQRMRRGTSKKELDRLMGLSMKNEWVYKNYSFSFMTNGYFWKGKEIHITSAEALFLFKWLVLKDDSYKQQRYLLRNMRDRLGKDFLKDIIMKEFKDRIK